MAEKVTTGEAIGKLVWALAHGEGLTIDDAALVCAGCETDDDWSEMDKKRQYRWREKAKRILCRQSRVLPIYDRAQEIEGKTVTVWQAVAFGELDNLG